MQFKGTEGWQTVSSSFAEQNTYSMPVYNPVHQQYEAADTTDIFTATFTDIGRISLKDNSIDLDKIKVADLIKDADTFANVDTKIMTAAAVKNYVDSSSAGITLTDTAPTSSSDFASSDIILEKDTGKLWWYSATNSKLYSHTFDDSVDLNFNVASFVSNDLSENGTYLIGDESGTLDATVDFQCTVNNPAGGSISSGTVTLSGAIHTSQTTTVSSTTLVGGSSPYTWDTADIAVKYPDNADAWTSGYKRITFSLAMNDGATSDTASFYINFKNKKWFGVDSSATLDGTGTSAGDVQNSSFSSSYVSTSITQSEVDISTTGTQYVHYLYPARISGTPTFKLFLNPTDFDLVEYDGNDYLSVTNANGFTENYKHYRSPQAYTDASGKFEVL